jgi:hypothetical protein
VVTLDTLSSRSEEETGSRGWPPQVEAQAAASTPRPERPGHLMVDASCASVVRVPLRNATLRTEPVNLDTLLSSGSASSLDGATAVVMAPKLNSGLTAVDAIEQLRARAPHVGIYVVAHSTAEVAQSLLHLATAGVDEVFCFDTSSDIVMFAETMASRLAAPAPETEIKLLWKWFRESPERSLVMHCVRNGFRLDVWSIRSQVFSACRKTLQNRMALLGLPSPGIISRCGRVLHAQELERRGINPTLVVAGILGFPSASAMQRSRRRLRKALMTRGRQALVFASLLK